MKTAAIFVVLLGLLVWLWPVRLDSGPSLNVASPMVHTPNIAATSTGPRFFSAEHDTQPTNVPSSKGNAIDALMASGRPEDALAAFLIADECRTARHWERGHRNMPPPVHPVESACAGILQRHLMEMPRLLGMAVKARVRGAILAQYRFGPLDGDVAALETRPGDPAVVEWQSSTRRALLEEGRRTGAKEIFADLSGSYQDGSLGEINPQLSLAYLLVYLELRLRIPGTKATHDARLIAEASRNLTPEQMIAAHALARKLIDECCPMPQGK